MKTCNPPDPQRFRAQATGIGYTRSASESTGRARAQRVIDCAPPEQVRHACGYPEPMPDMCGTGVQTIATRRGSLRRY